MSASITRHFTTRSMDEPLRSTTARMFSIACLRFRPDAPGHQVAGTVGAELSGEIEQVAHLHRGGERERRVPRDRNEVQLGHRARATHRRPRAARHRRRVVSVGACGRMIRREVHRRFRSGATAGAPTSRTGESTIRRSATERSPALPGTRRYQEPGAACSLIPRRVPPISWATAERSLSVVVDRNVTSHRSGEPSAVSLHAARGRYPPTQEAEQDPPAVWRRRHGRARESPGGTTESLGATAESLGAAAEALAVLCARHGTAISTAASAVPLGYLFADALRTHRIEVTSCTHSFTPAPSLCCWPLPPAPAAPAAAIRRRTPAARSGSRTGRPRHGHLSQAHLEPTRPLGFVPASTRPSSPCLGAPRRICGVPSRGPSRPRRRPARAQRSVHRRGRSGDLLVHPAVIGCVPQRRWAWNQATTRLA